MFLSTYLQYFIVPIGPPQDIQILVEDHAAHLRPGHQHVGQGAPLIGHGVVGHQLLHVSSAVGAASHNVDQALVIKVGYQIKWVSSYEPCLFIGQKGDYKEKSQFSNCRLRNKDVLEGHLEVDKNFHICPESF